MKKAALLKQTSRLNAVNKYFEMVGLCAELELIKATPATQVKKWVMENILKKFKEKDSRDGNRPQVTDELIEEKARELASGTSFLHMDYYKDFIRKLVEEMPAKKPRVSTEFVKKNRKLLILLIAKMEEEKLLDWTDGGTSLKILEANFENFIKQVLTEAGMEVIE